MTVTQEVGGRGRMAGGMYGVLPRKIWVMSDDVRSCVMNVTVVSAAVLRRSVVWQTDANNQYNRIGRSDFGGNWIDLNRESECSTWHYSITSWLTVLPFVKENQRYSLISCWLISSQMIKYWIGLSSVLRPCQNSIGYMGDGFYRSKDPTNSTKVL